MSESHPTCGGKTSSYLLAINIAAIASNGKFFLAVL